jgi:DNA-binding HxlR family transcriptional regulator
MTTRNDERHPLAEITELLGKKWVMRIIWELRGEPLTFRELQRACGDISPTVLNHRLKLLEGAMLVEKQAPNGYALAAMGRDLLDLYGPLNQWAVRWQKERRGREK